MTYIISRDRQDEDSRSIDITAVVNGQIKDVNVSRDKAYGVWQPAKVNWSALGSQPVEVAEAYAKLILFASGIATVLNADVRARIALGGREVNGVLVNEAGLDSFGTSPTEYANPDGSFK